MQALSIHAGARARQILREEGLRASRVRIVAGAAGGPKWIPLGPLDRYLFGQWLRDARGPIDLIGSSAGAWRLAALAQDDALERHAALAREYIGQRYPEKPSPGDVSAVCRKILAAAVNDAGIASLLTNAKYRLHVATARGVGPTNTQAGPVLTFGLGAALAANAAGRGFLDAFFERTYFHTPGAKAPLRESADFSIEYVALSRENVRDALLASGSIPLVLAGVTGIAGAPPGVYWDGGIIDYHLDLPYDVGEDELILFPHFSPQVIPGWFDKFVPWRRAAGERMANVVLLCPSPAFAKTLPLGKIPDRKDFERYFKRDDERIAAWNATVAQCEAMVHDFERLAGARHIEAEAL